MVKNIQSSKEKLVPPVSSPIQTHCLLGKTTDRAWHTCFEKINSRVAALVAGVAHRHHDGELATINPEIVAESFLMLQGLRELKVDFLPLRYFGMDRDYQTAIEEFWERPELLTVHAVRFLLLVGGLRPGLYNGDMVLPNEKWMDSFLPMYFRAHPDIGLLEFGQGYEAAGLDPRRIGGAFLVGYPKLKTPYGLSHSRVWPYWDRYVELLASALGPVSGSHMIQWQQQNARKNAFLALSIFPSIPESLIPLIWSLALGQKNNRQAAQRCLEILPDKIDRLVAELASGNQESRQVAAEWLGRCKDKSAVQPLLVAFKKEKSEAAKGTMCSALETLGASLEQFLDRNGLQTEAKKGLEKGVPKEMDWFPFKQLPVLHWRDDNSPVPTEVIQWWLIQGFKLKSAEPGVMLRKYCEYVDVTERKALGKFVLEAWLAEDLATIPLQEAEDSARYHADSLFPYLATVQWWVGEKPKTLEELYSHYLTKELPRLKGSATQTKGILSLAAACAGAEVVPSIHQYIKKWFGMRVHQCRALLQVLSWIDEKPATQLILSIATRFRTPSIQEEAHQQAIAVAARKGWSVNELADRTIPTAGLDQSGTFTLDFGSRTFSATLAPGMILALSDSDGKSIKNLPEPGKQDDAEKATEAKKSFGAAKKELKAVLASQEQRLYEATCLQRTWTFEEWNNCLNLHPIVRHLCQRLVWARVEGGKIVSLFRPLEDGSLTDSSDNPLSMEPQHTIQIAHECLITTEQSLDWQRHLKDYNIVPLFQQFGRKRFDLDDAKGKSDELTDFKGFVLDGFKLRSRATKLGYNRGQSQEGGWFYDYSKRFSELGLEVVLEFTGNSLPEENRKVALKSLRFFELSEESGPWNSGSPIVLSQVPSVLLSECWNDWCEIAADSPGYEPNWLAVTQVQ